MSRKLQYSPIHRISGRLQSDILIFVFHITCLSPQREIPELCPCRPARFKNKKCESRSLCIEGSGKPVNNKRQTTRTRRGASDVLFPANFKFTRLFNTGTRFYSNPKCPCKYSKHRFICKTSWIRAVCRRARQIHPLHSRLLDWRHFFRLSIPYISFYPSIFPENTLFVSYNSKLRSDAIQNELSGGSSTFLPVPDSPDLSTNARVLRFSQRAWWRQKERGQRSQWKKWFG